MLFWSTVLAFGPGTLLAVFFKHPADCYFLQATISDTLCQQLAYLYSLSLRGY